MSIGELHLDDLYQGDSTKIDSLALPQGRVWSWIRDRCAVVISKSADSVGAYRSIIGPSVEDSLKYRIRINKIFATNPTLEYANDSALTVNETFSQTDSIYSVLLITGAIASHDARILVPDETVNTFFFNTEYNITEPGYSIIIGEASSADGAAEFELDMSNAVTRAIVLSSPFPIIRDGVDPLSLKTGSTHSLAVYTAAPLTGVNSLTISYSRGDFTGQTGFTSEPSVRIFH